jgi:hypothetical protein
LGRLTIKEKDRFRSDVIGGGRDSHPPLIRGAKAGCYLLPALPGGFFGVWRLEKDEVSTTGFFAVAFGFLGSRPLFC